MMMIRKRTKMIINEQDAFLAYDSYGNDALYSNPDGVVIREYHGDQYTSANRLARTIRTLIGNAKHRNVGVNDVGRLIKLTVQTNPMIGLVSWNGGGGHFVMLDNGGTWNGQFYVSACDPWDGEVRLVPIPDSGLFRYAPDYPETIKVQGNMAGGQSSGYFNGWVVV
jgi:hypothetical protein